MSVLYSSDCEVICHPDGGYSGGGDGKCPGFFDEATSKNVVWEDDRCWPDQDSTACDSP